jgi:hypothetical protein
MKKILNRYFDFIGVKNEGKRRLLIIFIIFCYFYISYYIDTNFSKRDFGLEGDIQGYIFIITVPLILSLFSIGLITKIITWIKEGFNK